MAKRSQSLLPPVVGVAIVTMLAMVGRASTASGAHNFPSIIPKPVSLEVRPGSFALVKTSRVCVEPLSANVTDVAEYFLEFVNNASGLDLETQICDGAPTGSADVVFSLSAAHPNLGAEGYELEVTPQRIVVTAFQVRGLFFAVQTLLQLLPANVFGVDSANADVTWMIPCVKIKDQPRFTYRGMHLDVSRHFFPVAFVKRFIDLIAMHKMNVFHWHLTDDHGWRLAIKKYPKLTEVGAWRVDREEQPWTERAPACPGEKATYGGYYTQDDVREIIAYAGRRGVAIVPEVELPGHSSEVFAAYPDLSCAGNRPPVRVGAQWPNRDIFCAGNEATFAFWEDVLTEITELFPGEYVHIGGDEVDKTAWKQCAKCQARIREEGLANEDELQGYFIRRIATFLATKNKKLLGWDEIIGGGLAAQATVMSWRGVTGGIVAAQAGHDVVMTPEQFCYFDHYQGAPEDEPLAIGGYTPLKTVYEFEPVPANLSLADARHVIGAQGNVWTEYIATPAHVEYMSLPRMAALAEVLWSPRSARNWDDFRQRLDRHFARLTARGVNFSPGSFRVEFRTRLDAVRNNISVSLGTEQPSAEIRFTLDGDEPSAESLRYDQPFTVTGQATIRAAVFAGQDPLGHATVAELVPHVAVGVAWQPVAERDQISESRRLADGILGTLDRNDGFWQEYQAKDLDVVSDLGASTVIVGVRVGFLKDFRARIHLPKAVAIAWSDDGVGFTPLSPVREVIRKVGEATEIRDYIVVDNAPRAARFIRVHAENIGTVPEGCPRAGAPARMLVDEIVVDAQ